MSYKLQPAEQAESGLFYRLDGEAAERHGAIGYMRADFGRCGQEFWNTWFDIQKNLKTPGFKNELNAGIDALRNDGQEPPFVSRANLEAFCLVKQGYPLAGRASGFKIQTLQYTYTFHLSPSLGDYDIRVYAFDNRYLLPELAGQHELPRRCYSILPSDSTRIMVWRDERCYTPLDDTGQTYDELRLEINRDNEKMGVTRQQEAAMLAGSLFGWNTPAAKPWNYDRDGTARPLPPKEKERDYER